MSQFLIFALDALHLPFYTLRLTLCTLLRFEVFGGLFAFGLRAPYLGVGGYSGGCVCVLLVRLGGTRPPFTRLRLKMREEKKTHSYTVHSALYTLHPGICTPHFDSRLYTFIRFTLHFAFSTPHFKLYTSHFALHVTLSTLHSAIPTSYPTRYIPQQTPQ